ncbi:MAG: IclR family transcriptional regulator [Actinobacteria bacterium]|nr:IclR family transcriptional regulator [Actinomycetota bacterium]
MSGDNSTSIRAVDRALDVLFCFAGRRGGLGVTEIAEKTGLYKSTVHRLLGTLEQKGFVRQEEATGKYHLGVRMLELASGYLEDSDLTSVAYPEMRRLRDDIGETVSLYIRDGVERVRVQKVESLQAVRRVVQIGQRAPLYLGASGKVLLAHCEGRARTRILDGLPSGFDRAGLEEQLSGVAAVGYAISIEEREPGTASVAAPVVDRSGTVVGALCISGPASRFDPETIQRFAEAVKQSALAISARLVE